MIRAHARDKFEEHKKPRPYNNTLEEKYTLNR